jgi:uncharacterized membrane protein
MNKQMYLSELEKELANLSYVERADIMRDMEEYFREGELHGRTEDEIIKQLGSPKKLAETLRAEAKVKKIQEASSVTQKFGAVLAALIAILLLTPFNLIFVLFPLLFITLLLIVGWPIVIILAITLPIIWIFDIFLSFFVGFNIFALLALLFFAIGWCGLVVTVLVGFSFLTILYFKGIAALFMWNINFIKNRMRG